MYDLTAQREAFSPPYGPPVYYQPFTDVLKMRGLIERLEPRPFKEVIFGVVTREPKPNSRFPEGMTERKASAKARTKATAGPSAALRCAQDDGTCFV